MVKERLDVLVHERGLAESVDKAQRLILAGLVRVDGRVCDKAGIPVDTGAQIRVKARSRYVSRGADKLAKALRTFAISPVGWAVADVGASTGGFTDLLLQEGAKRVYAIDVGYGQLDWRLRQDPRVVVMERTNARYLEALDEPVDLAVIDVSFISLESLLPAVKTWLGAAGQVVALVKPQFEAPHDRVARGGVVRDRDTHRAVLTRVISFAHQQGWSLRGLVQSPIKGPKGNIEFLLWLSAEGSVSELDMAAAIEQVLSDLS
jgi:23S rRNA (cytidine1920-2'-O)/16S rRNA (cytidine1409-2'-O)-methyltransferase